MKHYSCLVNKRGTNMSDLVEYIAGFAIVAAGLIIMTGFATILVLLIKHLVG
jgi:hypothetical protein